MKWRAINSWMAIFLMDCKASPLNSLSLRQSNRLTLRSYMTIH